MSSLHIQLTSGGKIQRALSLSAELVVETNLTISNTSASLPTLVSTENIIGQINDVGFELASPDMVKKISNLVNTYYLTTERIYWHDISLDLEATPISYGNAGLYQEIGYMRGEVLQSVRNAQIYERQGDYAKAKIVQDNLVDTLSTRVQAKRSSWERIPEFLIRTAIPFVFSVFMGFSLHVLFASIFGIAFHINPAYF